MKIISGGQTGVDRAALDVALKYGVECGGSVPAGRLDENGKIPAHYPVTELTEGGFAERTKANVKDAQGTVLIFRGELGGGTQYAIRCSEEQGRPHQLIDARQTSVMEAAQLIREFVDDHKIDILNVAGPRQSEWTEGYDYACRVLERFIELVRRPDPEKLPYS